MWVVYADVYTVSTGSNGWRIELCSMFNICLLSSPSLVTYVACLHDVSSLPPLPLSPSSLPYLLSRSLSPSSLPYLLSLTGLSTIPDSIRECQDLLHLDISSNSLGRSVSVCD